MSNMLNYLYASTNTNVKSKQDRQCTYKYNTQAHLYNHCCCGKAICINIISVYLYSCLSYQAWKSHIFCAIYCLAVPHFSTLSLEGRNFFGEKKIFVEHKMCILTFSTMFVWNICYSKKNLVRYYHKFT
jgi:hypothetical protein